MSLTFALLAGLTFGAALAAVSLRSLVHSALCLALSLSGLGLIFVHLNAEFAGLVQVLVYVGAVAILIVFAVLLVRSIEPSGESVSRAPILGSGVTLAVTAVLTWGVWHSPVIQRPPPPAPNVTVRAVGERLMREYVVPLQALGLLLTVATLGAALIALPRRDPRSTSTSATPS